MREKRQTGVGPSPRLMAGLVLLALFMVSINLRPAITTIAGVMSQLPGLFGLDPALLPLLGTLPVLAFGLSGPIGPWLARRLGTGRAVAAALLVLAAALIVRATVPALLLPGTFLAGMAIMTASVLVPQIVKANRGTGWWTGLCTMGFGLGAALGAGLVQPLAAAFGGNLQSALAVWAVPALLGAFLIHRSKGSAQGGVPQAQTGDAPSSAVVRKPAPLRKQRTAWAVTAFFGLQAMLYFAITSWLAVYLVSRGLEPADAAALLAWFSLAGLPASLLAPVLASRPAILRIMAPGLGLSVAAALLGVLMAPVESQVFMVGILGVVQSAGFGLAMALVVIRSDGPESAGRLSAMSQGFGFALASLGPLGAGMLHAMTGGWELTFWVLAAEAVVLAGAGFLAIRGPLVSVGAAGQTVQTEQITAHEPRATFVP
ncbi:MFS transporter [Paenarthrobacter aurescens]|uniref:MFS transporter n=1 Tax=Paenarthrobacter aurescens TaxID=43663 RepID=A0A4Y3NFF6_PAEAU|nr:MFS transporter [Paenarthrobacter aurescens]MDO6142488.1 MFS transporter [Paenarthrobacter aurescens]MDO6146335.1 MFS transporter [Paenarthrobacter aurescens]MDO6157580.1 MFS transporter [Paenarthrobacter aurescens]MDO6161565.1 MFS transporter [Paenarthrobacter aurescens]GEB20754.1 MFS transporter [Paenarthrobacter aurescens]